MRERRRLNAAFMRWSPVAVMVAATLAVAALGGARLSLAGIQSGFAEIQALVAAHRLIALGAFTLLYAGLVGFAVFAPSSPMTLLAGMVFGPWVGGAACLTAKTVGGLTAYLIWRNAFRSDVERLHPGVRAMTRRIERNGFRHLLAIRLLPILPFGLVTIGAAAAKIGLRAFVAATAIGQLPAILLYSFVGAGVARVMAGGGRADIAAAVSIEALAAPIALMTGTALIALALQWRRPSTRRGRRWAYNRTLI